MQKEAAIVVKARTVKKRSEQYKKTIIELKVRAARFLKSNIIKLLCSQKVSKSLQVTPSQWA